MKKLIALILAFVLTMPCALAFDLSFLGNIVSGETVADAEPAAEAADGIAKFEGAGYASPEEAALAYAEALKNQDAMAAIATFAIESYVENADFEARAEQMKIYLPSSFVGMQPTENAYFRQVQVFERFGQISDNMNYAYLYSIWDAEQLGEFMEAPVRINEEMTAAELRDILAQGEAEFGFNRIEVVGIFNLSDLDPEAADTYAGERGQQMLARQCAAYGGDALAEVIVQLKIGGVDYLQFMQCVRYGDTWYNLNQTGMLTSLLAVTFSAGGLVPMAAFF